MNYIAQQEMMAQKLLISAAERIAKGKEMYCCVALHHAARDHLVQNMSPEYLAQSALETFSPTEVEVPVHERISGDFSKGTSHGWYGYPTLKENQRRRVLVLLLAVATLNTKNTRKTTC